MEKRHQALETEILEARAHPSIDNLRIVELKRRKLLIKGEIARLQTLIADANHGTAHMERVAVAAAPLIALAPSISDTLGAFSRKSGYRRRGSQPWR
jgi:hypothetical protein